LEWPYPIEWDQTTEVSTDVLVLGGGIAGCWAAIAAARAGADVALVEKGATIRSGAGGSGCDHWESAATNPCSRITPEDLTDAIVRSQGGYCNGISHYIECREGYDRLLDLEKMGGKIRDTEDEFRGADFRDEETKLLFAYDYLNRFTLRVWGTTFKPALYEECRRLGVRILDRTMATSLLSEGGRLEGQQLGQREGRQGGQRGGRRESQRGGPLESRVMGATAVHTRTGKFMVLEAGATILCMSRPSRLWLFSPELPGISEFRPPQCNGDGHAMAWRAGAEFTMMEKSVQAEWSGTRSFPPYATGNTHNTWYACSMVDAEGREIPWVDRDGNILTEISERYRPAQGQKLYLKGGCEPDLPSYEFQGPDILPADELLARGFKLPLYADLPSMTEHERRAIWGLMVGEEGKTKIPILQRYSAAGFDPEEDLLQSYGEGWKSAAFRPQERQLFGYPGGLLNDWSLRTNLEGLYAAGDQLFASNCHGHAATTGHYAGRHAAKYAKSASASTSAIGNGQVEAERSRVYSLVDREPDVDWRNINAGIAEVMQEHCGDTKNEESLRRGLSRLDALRRTKATRIGARNPHELVRSLEVLNVLTNAELVINACLARRASAKHLHFKRSDCPEVDPPEWRKFVTVRLENGTVVEGELPLDHCGPLLESYEAHNDDYVGETGS
jgi:succinate dehydrogenase/fumarate reductase flavoprotein subunit